MCLGQRTPDSILCPTILTSPSFRILTLLRKKEKSCLTNAELGLKEEAWAQVGSMHTYVCSVVIIKQIYYKPANICGCFLALVILFSTPACLLSYPASSPKAPTSELHCRLLQGQPQERGSKQTQAPPHLGKHNNQHCLVLRALNKNSHWCWLNK